MVDRMKPTDAWAIVEDDNCIETWKRQLEVYELESDAQAQLTDGCHIVRVRIEEVCNG